MKTSQTIQKACRVLRSRVNLKNASLTLPSSPSMTNDTEQIKESIHLYNSTWVMPLIDAIETGDIERLKMAIRHAGEGQKIGEK